MNAPRHNFPEIKPVQRVGLASRLFNDLRHAERQWQDYVRFDAWPGGSPYAALRDEAAARHARIRSQIAAQNEVAAQVDRIHAIAGGR